MTPLPSRRQPPALRQPEKTKSSVPLLWIGIGAGAAIAVAGFVLIMLVMRLAGPGDLPLASNATLPAGEASTAVATAPSVSSAAPPGGQPVSSIGPNSPLSPADAAPPPIAAPPLAPVPPPPLLAYHFKSGEEYAYSFTVKADVAGDAEQASGLCTLTLSREPPPAEFAAHEKSGQGNGSGFVVTSDGYVVTCAHVVEGSTKLEVVLGAQTYPAQVAAFDKQHDLAVVRIVAANLPTVSLANSDAVELGQEVRAVGFPLSTVLGDSVKITRGTVAGVVNTSGHKLFQVDASINPGNSGGPLVNELGQVVGVASSKLTGGDVDGVGFAVPASEVLSLLRSKGISPSPAAASQKLDGPALARRVTPAVALIKVTVGPGGYGVANRLVLDYSGRLTSIGRPHAVGHIRIAPTAKTESDRGKLLLSERGEVLHSTGNVQLPHLLGSLGALVIEPLADGDQRSWQTQRTVLLTQTVGQEAQNPMSLRFGRRSQGRFGQGPFGQSQAKVVVTPAIETCEYELRVCE